MKKSKRFLALLLVLCMAFGLVPFSVFAAENAEEVEVVETEALEEGQDGAQLLALTGKPADGTTQGAPFDKGTGGSGNFRIPGIVTLDSGRLVASCDARWNHTGDGAGLDTIVSRSDDNGKNWHYTFANYLGDNGNAKNVYSTSFIDPAIATDGQTVYMIVDLYPAGIALNTSAHQPATSSTGFDAQDRLLLRKNTLDVKSSNYTNQAASAKYDFYLENGKIYQKNGTVVSGYTVDDHFNITGSGVNTNLFCADSPYQPFPTNYLYLTSSADGQNWSAPQLLNLKNPEEQSFLVGPGNGTYDARNDRLIFTAYDHTDGYERTALIWRNADGTWHRSADATDTQRSSEATAVVLSDGTVRVFYRGDSKQLQYTDFTWQNGTYVPTRMEQTFGVNRTRNNQMSAIMYSRKVEGKDLILLSTASCQRDPNFGSSNYPREDGRIYAMTVEADGSMKLLSSFDVEPGGSEAYGYSCLTETKEGNIALLFEGWEGNMYYRHKNINDVVGDVQWGDAVDPEPPVTPDKTTVNIELTVGESKTAVENSGAYDGSQSDAVADITWVGTTEQSEKNAMAQLGSNASFSGEKVALEECLYDFDGRDSFYIQSVAQPGIYLHINGTSLGYPQNNEQQSIDVDYQQDGTYHLYHTYGWIVSKYDYLYFYRDGQNIYDRVTYNSYFDTHRAACSFYLFKKAADGKGGPEIPGYTKVSGKLKAGQYLIAAEVNGEYFLLHPSTSTTSKYDHVAKVVTETSSKSSTTVTFQGLTPGQTSVTVGSTIYNVTVKEKPLVKETVNLPIGQEMTFDNNGPIKTSPAAMVATAALVNGKLTIKGVGVGSTKFIAGGVEYTVNVSEAPQYPNTENTPFVSGEHAGQGQPVTKLTISKGLSYDLDLNKGRNVQWSVADDRIASVDRNGKVTGKQAGTTDLIATIDGVQYKIPVVVEDFHVSRDSKIYDFYAEEITDTTVYYSWYNDGYDYLNKNPQEPVYRQMIEGEVIYVEFAANANTAVNFYGQPDQGYALTRMNSTNSDGLYFRLHDENGKIDMGKTGYMNGDVNKNGTRYRSAGYWQKSHNYVGVQNDVEQAIQLGCDGGFGFTKDATDLNTPSSKLTFRSEKLPTVDKVVRGVLGTDGKTYRPYTEGMIAQAGEKVYYQITVEKYACQDKITYSNALVKDLLNNNSNAQLELFKGDGHGNPGQQLRNPFDITRELNADGLKAGTHTYFVAYTITENDLDTTLVNKANLSYGYASDYSAGNLQASASAEAKITATKFQAKDLVIDFGLPVTVHYKSWGKDVQLTGGSAKYGNVTVSGNNGWDVTYTPTTILQGVDTVTLHAKNGAEYQFHVYPATTVHYEEGFAALTGFNATGSANAGKQEAQLVGAEGDNYGYTAAYNQDGMTNGTEIVSDALNNTAELTFTGTGIDLYANCDTTTGSVLVKVMNNDTGKLAKFYQVDTRMKDGVTNVTGGQEVEAYSLPIVSVRDLPAASYTVELRHVNRDSEGLGGDIRLDGYRVHNTLADQEAYAPSERNPQYTELRDALLTAIGADKTTDGKTAVGQVHTAVGKTDGVVVLGQEGQYTEAQMNDLLTNGPKNELFVYPGQVVTFQLNGAGQLGMKAVNGAVEYTVNNGGKQTIAASADLFYDVSGQVTIKNVSQNILSLTLVKHFGDSAKVFAELGEEQMTYALRTLYAAAPMEEAEAALTVSLVDYSGTELGQSKLTAMGAAGEEITFTAAQISEAAKAQLGEDYALVDESAITDTTVVCGEEGQVSVQIGLVGVLHVTYVKRERKGFFGPVRETKVGSADLTVVQTSKKAKGRISGAAIRAAAPEGYRAGFLTGGQKVAFGAEKFVSVTVR